MKNSKSSINFIMENTPLSFRKIYVTETSLSDYHKLVQKFSRLVPLTKKKKQTKN